MPRGDALVLSIAAASIVAKVSRDRIMAGLDGVFPGYGFARHKGYGTEEHQAALACLGPSAAHRLSFAPLRQPGTAHEGPRPAGGHSTRSPGDLALGGSLPAREG
jgi:ribonuclease HII